MIIFMVLLIMLGVVLSMVSGVTILLIDPIICILICYGIYRIIEWVRRKH